MIDFKKKFKKILILSGLLIVFIIFTIQTAFFFFSKQILYNKITQIVKSKSNKIYSISFDKFRINLLTASVYFTDFNVVPDTCNILNQNIKTQSLYKISVDTFRIRNIYFHKLIFPHKSLRIGKLELINPHATIYSIVKTDTTAIIEHKKISYKEIEKDVFLNLFKNFDKIVVNKLEIKNGTFDFLRTSDTDISQNFSASKVSLFFYNFYTTHEIFTTELARFRFKRALIVIDNYRLNLNDGVHAVVAEKFTIDTKNNSLKFANIRLFPVIDTISGVNKYNFKIDNIYFYVNDIGALLSTKDIRIQHAFVYNFDAKIYNVPKKEIKFNKDTVLSKINFYPLFSNFLNSVQVDTFSVENSSLTFYKKPDFTIPNIEFHKYSLIINNFLVDSNSFDDSSRFFYAKRFFANVGTVKFHLTKSLSELTFNNLIASSVTKTLFIKNIRYKSNQPNARKFNSHITADSIAFVNFDFLTYANYNELDLQKINISSINANIQSYEPNEHKNPLFYQTLLTFAKKIKIKQIELKSGNVKFTAKYENRNFNLLANISFAAHNIIFDPSASKISKTTDINQIELILSSICFFSKDSLYSLKVEKLNYSTNNKNITLTNFSIRPRSDSILNYLSQQNISSLFVLEIPKLTIEKSNLNKALLIDSLRFNNLLLSDPTFKIIFYPQFARKIDTSYIAKIKKVAIDSLIKASALAQIIIYQSFPQFDSISLQNYYDKKNAIDSITKYALYSINHLIIKNKDFSFADTTSLIVNKIIQTAFDALYTICSSKLDSVNINNLLLITRSRIMGLQLSTLNTFSLNDIFRTISVFFPKISSDSLIITNGNISLVSNKNQTETNIFSSQIDAKLLGFDFNKKYIDSSDKILFSDNFIMNIGKVKMQIPSINHTVTIDKIDINSDSQTISLKNITIHSIDNKLDKPQLYAFLPNLNFNNVDFLEFYRNNVFYTGSMNSESSAIKIVLPQNLNKKVFVGINFLLPKFLKRIIFDSIKFNNSKINILLNNDTLLKTMFNLKLNNLALDSLNSFSKQNFTFPIDNLKLNLSNLLIKQKNKFVVSVEDFNFSLKDSTFTFHNLSAKIYDSTGTSNTKFTAPFISLNDLNIKKYLANKTLYFDNLEIDSAKFYTNNKKNKSNSTDISKIDLFALSRTKLSSLSAKTINVPNFTYETNKDTIKNINLTFKGLKIDSTTTITQPNLFYCDDFRFEIDNISRIIQKGTYVIETSKLRGSTKSKLLEINNLKYSPVIAPDIFQKTYASIFPYRITPVSIFANKIVSLTFNYDSLINKKALDIGVLNIDSVYLYAFTDLKIEHDFTKIKPNLAEKLFKIPYPINIQALEINNLNVLYKEKNPKNDKISYITLNHTKVKASNITNETRDINDFDKYMLINAKTYINNKAFINLDVYYDLSDKGKSSRIVGEIDTFKASILNTYTLYGANISFDKGLIYDISFDFNIYDTVAYGKMLMYYKNLYTSLMKSDTLTSRKLKFQSWFLNNLLIKKNNIQYGFFSKTGNIAYIHDPSYSEYKFWLKSLLSGMQSTILTNPKDYKKVKKIIKQKTIQIITKKRSSK